MPKRHNDEQGCNTTKYWVVLANVCAKPELRYTAARWFDCRGRTIGAYLEVLPCTYG